MHQPTITAVQQLGSWVAGLTFADMPADVQARHQLIWADYLTVAAAGAQLPEYQSLLATWPLTTGPVPLPGTAVHTTAETGSWLLGTVGVSLEQDEGNKFARGHPAAHVLPAVYALGIARGSSGADCMVAVAAGYEVAARFGRATTLNPGVHPHGNWGVAAAAAGCARLLGLTADQCAAAIDHGSGMGIAGHFASAVDGNLVRNSWMGAAQMSGIASAYLAAAGSAVNTGTAETAIGHILGQWDPAALTEELGSRWDVRSNYFKVHAACAFTHPPIDAVLQIVATHPELRDTPAHDFATIDIDTHYLAAGLNSTDPTTRLSAMFSIPFVVAVAIRAGQVTPSEHSPEQLKDPDLAALAGRVRVSHDSSLSDRLPAERAARVRITLTNGQEFTVEVPNPIGDSEFAPLSASDVVAKGHRLIDPSLVAAIWSFTEQLPHTDSIADIAELLTWPATQSPTTH